MIHIPIEILHLIFIRLALKDRLECMRVCHYWYDILDRRSLLHDLSIRGQFPRFKDMIERLPYRAAQVEYLLLSSCFYPDFDKRKLCNMFPNLRELELRYFTGGIPQQDYISSKFHFLYPMSKLERIVDIGECELTCQLIASNLCNRLKSLELDFSGSPDAMSSNVIPQLKNMPVLEDLNISNTTITLTELEIVHSNLPLLKIFKLKEIDLIDCPFPRDIKPAKTITTLNLGLERTPDIRTHIQFYKYMTKKYPSVTAFIHHDQTLNDQYPEYLQEIFARGVFPFLQNIKTQVNNYYFENYCNGLDAFKKFDQFGWKLRYLYLKSFTDKTFSLEELVQSEQSKYIDELSLEEILPEPMNLLVNMNALTTLSISCDISYSDRELYGLTMLNFSQLVEACPPTLSNLDVTGVGLTFNESTSNLTSIKRLKLSSVELTPDLARVLETNFPRLSSLHLYGEMPNDVEISMPSHNLESVRALIEYKEGDQPNHFSIKTMCDGKLEYYAPNPSQDTRSSLGDKSCVPVPKDELTGSRILKLVCASVKGLSLSVSEVD